MRFIAYLLRVAVVFLAIGAAPARAQDAYALGPGDTIEIRFVGVSDLDRSLTVGPDGTVSLPLIGEVAIEGRTLADLREEIPGRMSGAVYRQRGEGEEVLISLRPEEVSIDVSAYRPIFVEGAVNQPGSQPFRIGMTVRQAIAEAGGIESLSGFGGPESSEADIAKLRSDYQARVVELAAVTVEAERLRAELSGATEIDPQVLDGIGLDPATGAALLDLAQARLATSAEMTEAEAGITSRALERARDAVFATLRRTETLTQIVEQEESEVARVQSRVRRLLETPDQLAQTKRFHMNAVDKLAELRTDVVTAQAQYESLSQEWGQSAQRHRLELLDGLRRLTTERAGLVTALQGYDHRIRSLSSDAILVSAESPPSADAVGPRIVIHRLQRDGETAIEADPGTRLMPADVVSVRM